MLAPASRRLIAPGSRKLRTVASRAVALWRARAYDGVLDALYDLSGNGLHARLGSAVGADTNDPLRLQFSGEKYVYLPGVAGNYASAPDSAALSITGDIDIRVRLSASDWTPASTLGIVSKYVSSGDQRAYYFALLSSGALSFSASSDGLGGGSVVTAASSVATGFSDFSRNWIRVTRSAATGNVTFYTAADSEAPPNSWTQLGTVRPTTAQGIFDSAANLFIGAAQTGLSENFIGNIYRAQIYNGINGTKVFDFNAAELAEPYAAVTDAHGNVITLNRSTSGRKLAVVDRDLFLLGTDDYFEFQDNARLMFGSGRDFTVAALVRAYATPANFGRYIAKGGPGSGAAGWFIQSNGTNLTRDFYVGDGSGNQFVTTGAAASAGVLTMLAARFTRDRAGGRSTVFNPDLSRVEDTTPDLGAIDAASVGRIGARSDGATGYQDFEFFAGAIIPEALSAEELARLRGELLT